MHERKQFKGRSHLCDQLLVYVVQVKNIDIVLICLGRKNIDVDFIKNTHIFLVEETDLALQSSLIFA